MRNSEQASTRIMVANRPRIFRELLVRALESAGAGFDVVEVVQEQDIASMLRSTQPDWLIVSADDGQTLPAQAQAAIAGQTMLSTIAVSPDGNVLQVVAAGKRERTQQIYQNISLAELVSVLSTARHAVMS